MGPSGPRSCPPSIHSVPFQNQTCEVSWVIQASPVALPVAGKSVELATMPLV
jgi:hypothetical protein